MRLKKVELKGFIGIKRGMGLDHVSLDLTSLDGLVALEGDNGRGKTTFLENLQPFRTMPSHKGTLKRQCFLKDSFKDLTFTMNGDEYRTLTRMDALTTVPDEGHIWRNGEPQVSGKVSEFDKYLFELLGSQSLFFNSIFCAQNSDKLSDLRPAELKALYAEFLRLDRYINWEKSAKNAIGAYVNADSSTRDQIEKLNTRITALGNTRGDLDLHTKMKARLEIQLIEADLLVKNTAEALEAQKKETTNSLINSGKLIASQKVLALVKKTAEELATKQLAGLDDFAARSKALTLEIGQTSKVLDEKLAIENAVASVKRSEAVIKEEESKIHALDIEIKELIELGNNEKERLATEKAVIEAIKAEDTIAVCTRGIEAIKKDILRCDARVTDIDNEPELIKIQAKIDALEKSAAVLDNIDPGCTSEICGLITQSLEDKEALPAATIEYGEAKIKILDEFQKKHDEFRVAIDELTEKAEQAAISQKARIGKHQIRVDEITASMGVLGKQYDEKGKALIDARAERENWVDVKDLNKDLAEKAPKILVAQARLNDLNKQIIEVQALADKAEIEYVQESNKLSADDLALSTEITRLNELIDSQAEIKLKAYEDSHQAAEKQRNDLATNIETNDVIITACQKELKQLLILEEDLRQLEAQAGAYRYEASEWEYLAEACSKNGLRALEIEGVAPVITGHANEMLVKTFGPEKTVRFQTQDEDGKEVLDIVTIDADGSETLLSDLCGGERVWILKALRLAQTLISQEKSGRHYQSSLMDEEDGALSNANAIRFIGLYRTLMEMAKMDSCYYISHRPDAINLADHRILFKKGGISVI